MESSRKKALERMQKGIVTYQMVNSGWQVSNHLGDGYDLVLVKGNNFAKVELKAIDLDAIKNSNTATQHLSVNEISNASHLIITVFEKITLIANLVMTMRQFIENCGSKKYDPSKGYKCFLDDYRKKALRKSVKRKGHEATPRLDIDFSFNITKFKEWERSGFIEGLMNWKLSGFKDRWHNLEAYLFKQ